MALTLQAPLGHSPPEREFYVGAGLDEWDHERGDSPVLKDMAELDQAINLRVGGAWKLFVGTVFADFAQDVATHEGAQVKLRYPHHPDMLFNLAMPYSCNPAACSAI